MVELESPFCQNFQNLEALNLTPETLVQASASELVQIYAELISSLKLGILSFIASVCTPLCEDLGFELLSGFFHQIFLLETSESPFFGYWKP